ncbi:MAG: putative peptidoglycan lipid flippase MurJ [Myxococcaceae bacterium]|nr:putative peptidoglycan lipid flippase MurJ [Myxococcaceae bacterium]
MRPVPQERYSPIQQMSETGLLARRAGLVAIGTFASRVLGLVRESVVAAMFSVASTDAFFIAFTIPNTLRMVLGEGAVANAFVPVFSQVRTQRGAIAARTFLARFGAALGAMLLLATLLGVAFAPYIALGYAGGLRSEPARFELVITLTKLMFPLLLLAGLGALATGVLNVMGNFTVPALAPALQNLAMIAAPFALASTLPRFGLDPILSLAFGALLGGVLQILVQLPALRRAALLPRPEPAPRDPDVRRALGLMAPLALGLGVYQLNMLLSRLFASFLPAGSQSYLNYGQRVIEIPQGMFALAVASAALPTLARLRNEGKHEELLSLFRYSLRLTLFIAVPASAALYALSEPIAAVLFGRGAFQDVHIIETGSSLAVQGLGVWAVAGVRSVIPMFAAHQDTRTPVLASAVNLVTFLIAMAALIGPFNHVGIAAANSIAASVQLVVLLRFLRKHTGALGLSAVLRSTARVALASLGMALSARWLASRFDWVHPSDELSRIAQFSFVGGMALVIFLGLAWLLRSPELGELGRAVRNRRKRAT